jgi:hypothetical protein
MKENVINFQLNKDCKTCKHIKDCVNVGDFKVSDCLQYEMTISAMNEEIEGQNVRH